VRLVIVAADRRVLERAVHVFDLPIRPGMVGLGEAMLDTGFETRLTSSMALARTSEAIHNGSDKNDPKNAQVIRDMLRTGLS
jgi:hypothetical protein